MAILQVCAGIFSARTLVAVTIGYKPQYICNVWTVSAREPSDRKVLVLNLSRKS